MRVFSGRLNLKVPREEGEREEPLLGDEEGWVSPDQKLGLEVGKLKCGGSGARGILCLNWWFALGKSGSWGRAYQHPEGHDSLWRATAPQREMSLAGENEATAENRTRVTMPNRLKATPKLNWSPSSFPPSTHTLNLLWGSRKAPLPPSFSFQKYLWHFNIYCIYSALNFTCTVIFFPTMYIFSPQICYACILNKQSVWSQVKGNWCLEKLFPFLHIIKSSYFDFTCIEHHCFLTKLIFLLWSDSSAEELPLKGQCAS